MLYAIFDMDGVLVDTTHRLHHITELDGNGVTQTKAQPDWEKYLQEEKADLPGSALPLFLSMFRQGVRLYIVTARKEPETVKGFLKRHSIPTALVTVYTRAESNSSAPDFKVAAVGEILDKEEGTCVGMFEDSWQNVKTLQQHYPSLPLFRLHNHIRPEDVAGY